MTGQTDYKQIRKQFLYLSESDRSELLQIQVQLKAVKVDEFKVKYEKDFYIPLFVTNPSQSDQTQLASELRLWTNLQKEITIGKPKKATAKGELSLKDKSRIRKELYLVYRPKYKFAPLRRILGPMQLFLQEKKEQGIQSGLKVVNKQWHVMPVAEREKYYFQERVCPFRQNRLNTRPKREMSISSQ